MKQIYKGEIGGGCCAKVRMDFKNCGSSVEFPSDKEPYHLITIGCAFSDWTEIFDSILHELMEMHMCNMELSFQRWYRGGADSGDVWFHMTHAEYSECISRASQSIIPFLHLAKIEFDNYIQDLLK